VIKFIILTVLSSWLVYRAARILPNWIISKKTVTKIDTTLHNIKANVFTLCITVLIVGASFIAYGLWK